MPLPIHQSTRNSKTSRQAVPIAQQLQPAAIPQSPLYVVQQTGKCDGYNTIMTKMFN
jgi:hypothetical protein